MEEVYITHEEDTEEGWEFSVEVKSESTITNHNLCLNHDDWDFFSDVYNNPRDLIIKTFHFLLEREPQDSLVDFVNISDLRQSFPEFEEEIGIKGGES